MEAIIKDMRDIDKRKMKAYDDWVKCQNHRDREGYHSDCKKLYDKFSALMQEQQSFVEKLYHIRTDFQVFQQRIRDTPQKGRVKRAPKFPKTVILAVNVHGSYRMNKEQDDVAVFELPKGMTLRTITAAPPGVSFMTCEKIDKDLIQSVIDTKDRFNAYVTSLNDNPEQLQKDLTRTALLIAETFRTQDKTRIEAIASAYKTENRNKKQKREGSPGLEQTIKDFAINHSDKTYQVHSYKGKDKVPKKGYQIKYKDILQRTHENASEIKILNMTHTPNLSDDTWFDIDKHIWEHPEAGILANIKMEDIIKYLNKYGCENLILLDFSCSNLDREMGSRGTRVIRKRLMSTAVRNSGEKRSGKRTRRSRSD
jgi:hypothetical protein